MKTRTPIEVTTRYATTVDTLPEAFTFIMSKLDDLGGTPRIQISPVWVVSEDPDDHPHYFSVVVHGFNDGTSNDN